MRLGVSSVLLFACIASVVSCAKCTRSESVSVDKVDGGALNATDATATTSAHEAPRDVDASAVRADEGAAIAEAKKSTASYAQAMRIGRTATRDKRHDDAVKAFDAAIAARPQDGRAHAERGYALLQANKLDEANEALEQAVSLGAAADVDAQAWFNLGLLREKKNDTEGARVAFAISVNLRPSKGAMAKLGGGSACPVERIAKGKGLPFAKTWRALARMVKSDDPSEEPTPENENEAKEAVCTEAQGHTSKVYESERCEGAGPWTVTRNYMAYRQNSAIIFPVKGGFLYRDSGIVGGWPAICSGSLSESGKWEGTMVHIAGSETPGVIVEAETPDANEGQFGEGNHCVDGVTTTRDAFYDAHGKHLGTFVRVDRGEGKEKVELTVQGARVILKGNGCDEEASLPLGATAK